MQVTIDLSVIGFAMMLLIQGASLVWFGSKLHSRVSHLEEWVRENRDMPQRLVLAAEQLSSLGKTLDRINARLDERERHSGAQQ